jgi:heat shock protein HslJ
MGRTRLIAAIVLFAFGALFLGGCSSEATQEPAPVKLEGTSWNCIEIKVNDAPVTVPADTPITAEFGTDGTLSGNSGVNNYSTTYETDDAGKLTVSGEIVSTKMAGPEDAMARESAYLTALATVQSYQVDDKNGQLVLFGPAENTVARYEPAK